MRSPTSQDRTNRRRRLGWTLAGIAGAALLATALWLCVAVLPQRLYPSLSNADLAGLSPADQAARREGRDKPQNDARTTLLQALAALLVLSGAGIGATVTLRQVRTSREQLELAREEAKRNDERLREQIAIAQEGQITERFTRAVDQLGQPGSDRLDVRLGGLYALERIGHDSPTHRLAVLEILTAFIRSYAPWPPRLPGQYHADAPINQVPELQIRTPDIQAALTIIGRRSTQKDDPHLDLNQTDLRKANLGGANLSGVRLRKANLTEAWLGGADLIEARLEGANLTRAGLTKANLTEAWLNGADLTEAGLGGANLIRAEFNGANLTGTQLVGANLRKIQLIRANLTRTVLERADLTEAMLGAANLTGAMLSGADLTGAVLDGADLTGAQLRTANLTEAQLGEANLTEAWLHDALANRKTVWPAGWDRTRRANAGVDEPDEEAPPAASSPG
jgi:uncharacterized protein YjbI with pentapeptide repeats